MFEVGFSELLMVGLVALLVIGPEKLPKAARLAGFWLGKTRSTITAIQDEIRQEFHAEEMRQLAQQHLIADDLQQAIQDGEAAIQDINNTIQALPDAKSEHPDDKSA